MGLVSKNCVDFVKQWEAYYSQPYYDCVGVLTLGYGMTGAEIAGLTYVSEPQAAAMLQNLLDNKYAAPIKAALDARGVSLTQNQFDALASICYNIGVPGLLGSTLFRNVCAGVRDVATITEDFCMWDKGGNPLHTIQGLLNRRQAEARMFFSSGNVAATTVSASLYYDDSIKTLQQFLNSAMNAGLKVDGYNGTNTTASIKTFQSVMGLQVDGIPGTNTWAAIHQILAHPTDGVFYQHYEYATRWIQWRVGTHVDGVFGNGTADKVRDFQQYINNAHGEHLTIDGVVGSETWRCMFHY